MLLFFISDEKFNLMEKIIAKKANIKNFDWQLTDVTILLQKITSLKKQIIDNIKINSIYNYEKINSLFKNFNTMSF